MGNFIKTILCLWLLSSVFILHAEFKYKLLYDPLKNKNSAAIETKIKTLPCYPNNTVIENSNFAIDSKLAWKIQQDNNIYYAAILFERVLDGIYSDSQAFATIFCVWKNGELYFRHVIEYLPNPIEITNWKLIPDSNELKINLEYQIKKITDNGFSFEDDIIHKNLRLPVIRENYTALADFENLPLGNFKIKNGVAMDSSKEKTPDELNAMNMDELENYKKNNPKYSLIFPHIIKRKDNNNIYHGALVDFHHNEMLAFCVWKNGKLFAFYPLDYYDSYYSSPYNMKIFSLPNWKSNSDTEFNIKYNVILNPIISNMPSEKIYKTREISFDMAQERGFDMRHFNGSDKGYKKN